MNSRWLLLCLSLIAGWAEHGEWFGYLRRDGRISSRAKGTIY